MDVTFAGAALAGFLAFFTPCILPMVPFYLSYMAGLSMTELRGEGEIAPGAQRRLFLSAVFFALGVTSIFMLMGMGATALGQVFRDWFDVLRYAAAALIFVFGLHFLGVIRIGIFYREARMESKMDPSSVIGAYVMGLAFGFGWSACVGPVLATILMIASGMGEVWRGGLLLALFGIGMTAPFVVAALFARPFLNWVQRNRKYQPYVEKVLGVMLVVFAILIATGMINEIANWMIDTFPVFSRLG
ncbi:cytochrome c biogenesis protein CcdA [Lutimaribacter sp. EGI FJ00015]|uniref:Cytochrome c biogenesis protein CcdA n=1 Tax=Lutimaribacter degradans TaxID=2945989 RepID=A0ACC5ZWB9_9RHOB|nr:cytochrome c biogenesis protein CcdA [Lutimaribacter sp. EGI FJ00013]MCM2562365.1 cytochrome c biogenesis protein CcdA [Lutimaribacter sp. EGI FJ00013]MCO0613522.1 cytochrome c biogenesis protein CcdA [Lutimaribacter sp. EGI FJ00015]MCO0636494.1 cytochrome c biogenesis protein CcdA [Lutimaribacter sp. EGI FJ00014]